LERYFTCANCDHVVCGTENYMDGPENCPTRTMSGTLEEVRGEYEKPDVAEFARQASIQEYECYMRLPEGMTPRNPRVEEVVQFAKKMGYHTLGIAFCAGLRNEARILDEILTRRGFDSFSSFAWAMGLHIVSQFPGPPIFCSSEIPMVSLGMPPTWQQTDTTSKPLRVSISSSMRASLRSPAQKAIPSV